MTNIENRYYYSILNTYEKLLARKMYEGYFNGITKFDYSGRVDVKKVTYFLQNDCPELYFVNQNGYTYTSSQIWLSSPSPFLYTPSERRRHEEYFAYAVSRIARGYDEYSKLCAVHDYALRYFKYESASARSAKGSREHELVHSMLGPLVYGKGVCSGISKAVQYLLRELGIYSIYVSGTSWSKSSPRPGPHGWLVVRIGGRFCHVDFSHDVCGTESPNNPDYSYFCLTDGEILLDHTLDRENYPNVSCSSPELNHYRREGRYFTSLADLSSDMIARVGASRARETHYDFRLCGKLSDSDFRSFIQRVMQSLSRVNGVTWSSGLQNCYHVCFKRA